MVASSSVGSDVFFGVAILLICLFTLQLLRYYIPLRTTPAFLLVPVFLALALPASIILLVPIDLASSAGADTGGLKAIWLPQRLILVSWRIGYWLTYALTWAILPLLGEYSDSGYREPKDKILYSLRSNGQYWLMVLGSGILGSIYLFIQGGFQKYSVKTLAMALAYAWGLVLVIYLMGHGLVAVPRRLYRQASIPKRLRAIQSRAPKVHDRLLDAIDELDRYESDLLQLRQRKTGTARDHREWIEELAEASSVPESAIPHASRSSRSTVPPVITERYLADLSRKLKRARHQKFRFADEWDRLVRSAVQTQAILDSAASKRLEFPRQSQSWYSRITLHTPYTRYILHYHVAPVVYYISSFFLSLASVAIVWSSVLKSLDAKLSLVGWSVVHHPPNDRHQIGLAGQCLAACWILYMCGCTFYSMTEVKLWGNRALVHRGTYPESACWYSLQVAKLTVPLVYNFITFLPPTIYLNTVFHGFLGKLIVLTPLGSGFQNIFPALILVPVAMALFGVYGKVQNWFSFDFMVNGGDDLEQDIASSWREGRSLIAREIQAGPSVTGAGTSVGLASREDGVGRYRDEPEAGGSSNTGVASSRQDRARPARLGRERRTLISTSNEDDDEQGGGFFGDFAQRVRNTFETADFSFERPKWMGGNGGGNETDTGRRNAAGNSGAGDEGNNGWMSLFGGRSEGRVRL